jgi:hypothetical protein
LISCIFNLIKQFAGEIKDLAYLVVNSFFNKMIHNDEMLTKNNTDHKNLLKFINVSSLILQDDIME